MLVTKYILVGKVFKVGLDGCYVCEFLGMGWHGMACVMGMGDQKSMEWVLYIKSPWYGRLSGVRCRAIVNRTSARAPGAPGLRARGLSRIYEGRLLVGWGV